MEWAQKRYRKNIDVDDFFFFFLGKQRRMEKVGGGRGGEMPMGDSGSESFDI